MMLVAVLVGDSATDGARADAFQGMMSNVSDLVRLVQLLVVDHPVLQSRDEVAASVVSRRCAVHQHLQ